MIRKENKTAGRILAVMEYIGKCPHITRKIIKEDDFKICKESMNYDLNDNSWISNILKIWRSGFDFNGPMRFFVDDIWFSYWDALTYLKTIEKIRNLSNFFWSVVPKTENIRKAIDGNFILNDKTKNAFLAAFDFPEEIQPGVFIRCSLLFGEMDILNNLEKDSRGYKMVDLYNQSKILLNGDLKVF